MTTTCKGINCTSNGATPHSAECIAEHNRVTNAQRFDDMPPAVQSSTMIDAQRYRAIRLIATEADEAKRSRMMLAFDDIDVSELFDVNAKTITPDEFDALFDKIFLIVAGARDNG